MSSVRVIVGITLCVLSFLQIFREPSENSRVSATTRPELVTVDRDSNRSGEKKALYDRKDRGPATSQSASPAKSLDVDERASLIGQIQETSICYQSLQCDFPQTDPRSYEFAVGGALRKQLLGFLLAYRTQPAAQADLEALAREHIQSFDGHVQDAALQIFAALPVSEENLDALVQGLNNVPDASIMKLSIAELQRYLGSPWESKLHDFLAKTIASGPQYSSLTASEAVLPFITGTSAEVYATVLSSMNPESRAAKNLKSALSEHQRLLTGG